MDAEGIIKLGPAGAERMGKIWDDRGRINVVQVFIWHDATDGVRGIQLQYVEDGDLVLGDLYGCASSWSFHSVQLDPGRDYITSISGRYSSGDKLIKSLEISTDKLRHGPFGCKKYPYPRPEDPEFHFEMGHGRQFFGFHGSANESGLTSIGVYLKPMTTLIGGSGKDNGGILSDDDCE